MQITMNPIGFIKSEFTNKEETPRQGMLAYDKKASVEILEEYQEGIRDIEEGSYGVILFYFHKSEGYEMVTVSRKSGKTLGLFSTRSPNRPNGIGISIVRFTKKIGRTLEFEGVDMLEGTPVLDIKPYSEELIPKF